MRTLLIGPPGWTSRATLLPATALYNRFREGESSSIVALRSLLLVLSVVVLLVGCGGESVESHPTPATSTVESEDSLRAVEIASGLDRPVYVTAAPGEPGRLYVVGQAGVVWILEGDELRDEPFLDLSALTTTSPVGESASEQGLLSLAFAPDYETSGRFYVDYTDRDGNINVVEYRARDGHADPASARRLLFVEKDNPIHNGGQLQFGPDGALYVSVGDDRKSQAHSQNLEPGDLFGKIVRLDGADRSVTAYGLRNPWRFSFDRQNGDLWIGDVGEIGWEEVSRVPASAPLPVNLGWDAYEGHEAFTWEGADHRGPQGPGELVWPISVFGREAGCAVIGGYVYRGEKIPAALGRYVYGDFCTGTVWSFDPAAPQRVRHELDLGVTLASFGEDEAGELYLVSRTGSVYSLRG